MPTVLYNLCQQLILSRAGRQTVSVFDFTLLSPHCRISTWENRAGSLHLATHTYYSHIRLSFLRNLFMLNRSTFCFNRFLFEQLNDLVFHGLFFKLQTSNWVSRNLNISTIRQQQEFFYLQDELPEMICAHLQETYFVALGPFSECKYSSSFFSIQSLKNPRRVLSTQPRQGPFKLPRTSVISKTDESWMCGTSVLVVRSQQSNK